MTQTISRRERAPVSVTKPPEGRPVENVLLITFAIGVGLPMVSSVLRLYDSIQHWGKLVHAVDGFCAALIFGLLFLGWRERARVELTDELAALLTMFFGVFFGVMWEIVEFVRDWVAYSDLQKSNTDTMTDFLCNDLGVVIASLVAMRLYCHVLGGANRLALGTTAEWLVDGPSHVLDRHGFLLTIIVAVLIATTIALLWFAGRPVPGIPIP